MVELSCGTNEMFPNVFLVCPWRHHLLLTDFQMTVLTLLGHITTSFNA